MLQIQMLLMTVIYLLRLRNTINSSCSNKSTLNGSTSLLRNYKEHSALLNLSIFYKSICSHTELYIRDDTSSVNVGVRLYLLSSLPSEPRKLQVKPSLGICCRVYNPNNSFSNTLWWGIRIIIHNNFKYLQFYI